MKMLLTTLQSQSIHVLLQSVSGKGLSSVVCVPEPVADEDVASIEVAWGTQNVHLLHQRWKFEFSGLIMIVIKFLLTLYNRIEHLHALLQWLKFGF